MRTITAEQLAAHGLDGDEAGKVAARVSELLGSRPAQECWSEITASLLTPAQPFSLHTFLYDLVFSDWDRARGPRPAWTPSDESIRSTNIAALMADLAIDSYPELHAWSVRNRAEFWDTMVARLNIRLMMPYSEIVDLSAGVERPAWLKDARLNIAESCFGGEPDAPAIVYQPEGGALATMTYAELDRLSNRVANALSVMDYNTGDALACYMPMTAESVVIYLGIVKAGCVVVSIADSFAPDEIEKRLRLSNAKGIFTQDFLTRAGKSFPLYDKVVEAGGPPAIVLPSGAGFAELRDGDVAWNDFMEAGDQFETVPCGPDDCTNILFSSGTTGDPKAIPWTQTTPIRSATDGHLHHDIRPGDVVAWPTNLGWMMGPWLIYASLVNRATIALYYGAPTGRGFAEFVQDAKVTMLGVVPSLVKAWRNGNCTQGLDWSAVRAFSSTGECSNADDMLWLMSRAGYRPVIEYCGGTEIGGGYITGTVAQPASPATFSTPALGLDFVLMDEDGQETDSGEVFLVPPSIGLSNTLLNRDHHEVYYADTPAGPDGAQLRRHGDEIERLGGGFFCAHGRADDTMNLGGIKVSSTEIERTLSMLEDINETAAIAVESEGGGPALLVIYAVPRPGAELNRDTLKAEMQIEIKQHLNPLFKIHDVMIVESLPRTASNKVMRRKLRGDYRTGV